VPSRSKMTREQGIAIVSSVWHYLMLGGPPVGGKMESHFMDKRVELALSWLPFVVLIVVWVWIGRKNGLMGRRGSSGYSMLELYEQQVAETRRMNGILERIAVSLEKRESGSSR
jgi:hypothetical protein